VQLDEFDLYRSLMSPEMDSDLTLEDLLRRPEWHDRAACRGMGNDQFFPHRGEAASEAKAICARCPVRAECLDFARDQEAGLPGIWGGLSGLERRRLPRPAVAARALLEGDAPCGHCGDPTSATARTGLCTTCRSYRSRFGRLPSPESLAVRAQRRRKAG
jgi:WhiB family redox-sensing transcriptional regulator